MSLCQALNTYYGVVMSADRRLMTTILERDPKETFLLTDSSKKLFASKHGYGITYSGAASIKGIPTQYYIGKYLEELELDLSVEQACISLAEKLKSLQCENIIIIMAGFYNGEAYICCNNTNTPENITTRGTFGVGSSPLDVYSGRVDVAEKYLKTNKLSFDYKQFTLDDAAQFLAFINYSTACELHFAQTPQDVSFDCDMLIITQDSLSWTTGFEHLPR